MNKNIKLIVESVFDDDIFNLNDIETEVSLHNKISLYKYYPENEDELWKIIANRIFMDGNECDLNDIDTSKITDMQALFFKSEFNGNISLWDVSNVTNMGLMFFSSKFNGDISLWDVSRVTDMHQMFNKSNFNLDISNWDVSNVTTTLWMFEESPFDKDISKWKLNPKCMVNYMFNKCPLEYNKEKQCHK